MPLHASRPTVLFVALALAGPSFGQDAKPRGPEAVASAARTATVAPPEARPVEQVVKLWKAGLSEEFLRRKVERETIVYRLTTDDIIACKAAGVPESIIETMMKTDAPKGAAGATAAPPAAVIPIAPPAPPAPAVAAEPAPSVAPPPPAVPAVGVPPVAPAPTPPSLASRADRSWDGVVRRSPGVVLFKNPWQQGSLAFRAETLSWRDAGDESKSFALLATSIREHFLVCPKDASSDEACFEWGVKTADGEERFRDVAWERADSPKPRELFTFLEALYPDLPKARVKVGKKK